MTARTDADYWKTWKTRDVFDADPPRYAPTRSSLAAILRAEILSYEEAYAMQCNGYRVRAIRDGIEREFTFDAFHGLNRCAKEARGVEDIRKGLLEYLCAKSAELWP